MLAFMLSCDAALRPKDSPNVLHFTSKVSVESDLESPYTFIINRDYYVPDKTIEWIEIKGTKTLGFTNSLFFPSSLSVPRTRPPTTCDDRPQKEDILLPHTTYNCTISYGPRGWNRAPVLSDEYLDLGEPLEVYYKSHWRLRRTLLGKYTVKYEDFNPIHNVFYLKRHDTYRYLNHAFRTRLTFKLVEQETGELLRRSELKVTSSGVDLTLGDVESYISIYPDGQKLIEDGVTETWWDSQDLLIDGLTLVKFSPFFSWDSETLQLRFPTHPDGVITTEIRVSSEGRESFQGIIELTPRTDNRFTVRLPETGKDLVADILQGID